jgi:uncharacterized membrane protein
VVHFPIALLLLGFALEVGFLMTRIPLLRDSTRLVVAAGCVSAIAAASLGWAAAAHARYPGELAQVLVWHRLLGITLAVGSLVLLGLSEAHHRGNHPKVDLIYRIFLVLAASLVGVTGHLGGSLIFGLGYLIW